MICSYPIISEIGLISANTSSYRAVAARDPRKFCKRNQFLVFTVIKILLIKNLFSRKPPQKLFSDADDDRNALKHCKSSLLIRQSVQIPKAVIFDDNKQEKLGRN